MATDITSIIGKLFEEKKKKKEKCSGYFSTENYW